MTKRDLRHEHIKRKEHNRRLLAEIERGKANAFIDRLRSTGQTYTTWLNKHIDNELDKT